MSGSRSPGREAAAMDALPQRSAPQPAAKQATKHTARQQATSGAYGQLVLAGEKLTALIARMQNRSAKEQSKLARQLYVLIKKFGRR